MDNLLSPVKGLPLLACCVLGLATLPAKPLDLTTPVQQRIAIKGHNAMSIGWNTCEQPILVCVHYGTSAEALNMVQCSTNSETYSSFWAAVRKFPDIIKTLWRIARDLEGGSHGNGSGSDAFQAILETFHGQLAPIAARKPCMAGPGNHEALCSEALAYARPGERACPEGQKNFADCRMRFGPTMPTAFASMSDDEQARASAGRAAELADPPFWYSLNYGTAHFVMIDTETDFPAAPDEHDPLYAGPFGAARDRQLAFLEADLAAVDRAATPWVVVSGHRPWYTTGGASEACGPCGAAFEGLLYKYGVDLAVFGHVHNAQRHLPVYAGEIDPRGLSDPRAPMCIVTGGAGIIEGLREVGSKPDYTAFAYADDFSYGRVSFLDSNRLQVDFIRSSTGETLELYKSHQEQFVV